MIIHINDEEAGSYAADIRAALTKAGWTIGTIDYKQDIREGVGLHYEKTTATNQKSDDLRQPKPNRILQEAFRLAGLQLAASGSGSGVANTKDELTITIAARRRDTSGDYQKWQ
jgi:hypothetical protein